MCKYLAFALFLAFALIAPAALADTLSFSFSFSGDNSQPGTVTGTIEGLQNNTTSAATALYIDTATNNGANDTLPYNVLGSGLSATDNTFTVTNGVITGADFAMLAFGADSQEPDFILLEINSNAIDSGANLLDFGSGPFIRNTNGINGVTFQLLQPTAATPEPGSIALFGTGLLGAVGVVRKRFR
jgi:hypothetical protein